MPTFEVPDDYKISSIPGYLPINTEMDAKRIEECSADELDAAMKIMIDLANASHNNVVKACAELEDDLRALASVTWYRSEKFSQSKDKRS